MRKSEIFEAFIKIAQEKNMIAKDAPEKAIKELEQSKRTDSISNEKLLELYNVKPDAPKDMKYDVNISERAHPNKVVISPAYDKVNSIYKNLNDAQNLRINIVNLQNDGQVFKHKYAAQELALNLVRLGNSLDNINQTDLCKLSDYCLFQIQQSTMTKQAFLTAALVVIPSLLGALYAHQHLDDSDLGFVANAERLQSEVADLITANDNFGIGYKYRQEFISEMQKFDDILRTVSNSVKESYQVLDQIEKPKTAQELTQLASQPDSHNAINAYNNLKSHIAGYEMYFRKILDNFSDPNYKNRQIEEKGAITNLLDKSKLHGGFGLISDDFDDVKQALTPFMQSYNNLLNSLKKADSIQESAKQDIAKYKVPEETANKSPETSISGKLSDLEEEAKKLF